MNVFEYCSFLASTTPSVIAQILWHINYRLSWTRQSLTIGILSKPCGLTSHGISANQLSTSDIWRKDFKSYHFVSQIHDFRIYLLHCCLTSLRFYYSVYPKRNVVSSHSVCEFNQSQIGFAVHRCDALLVKVWNGSTFDHKNPLLIFNSFITLHTLTYNERHSMGTL